MHFTHTLHFSPCVASPAKKLTREAGLGGLVHEEAHYCFPYFIQSPLKRIDAGSTNCPLIPSINYSEKNTYSSPVFTEI